MPLPVRFMSPSQTGTYGGATSGEMNRAISKYSSYSVFSAVGASAAAWAGALTDALAREAAAWTCSIRCCNLKKAEVVCSLLRLLLFFHETLDH